MKKLITGLFFLALMGVSFLSFNNSSGPGGGYTNAPSESTCISCHSGGSLITSGSTWSNIRLKGNFVGGGYLPDSTYAITISHKHTGISRFGFQVTSLDGNNNPAGELKAGSSSRVRVRTRTYSGRTRYYIEHTNAGTARVATDSTAWTFEWKAPSNNVGDVTFYSVVNSTNSNNNTSGDQIFAKTFVIKPSDSLPMATASSDTTQICQRSSMQFRGSGTANPTAYIWSFPGGSPSSSNAQHPQINYNAPGNYQGILQVRNKFGLSAPDTVFFRVNSSPNAIISGAAQRTKCTESSETLIADFVSGATYRWTNGARTRDITVTDSGIYKVEVSLNGCSNVSNEVRVQNYPRNSMTLSTSLNGDSICQGGLIQLSAASGFQSYRFYDSNQLLLDTTANVVRFNVNKRSLYYVLGYDQNNCQSDSSPFRLIKIHPQLDTPNIQCIDKDPFFIEFSWTVFDHYDAFEVSMDSGRTWIAPSSGSKGKTHKASGLYPDTDYEVWVRGKGNGPCMYSPIGKGTCKTGQCNNLNVQVQSDTAVCLGQNARVEVNGLEGKRYSIAFEKLGYFTDTIFFFTPQLSKQYVVEVIDSTSSGCPPTRRFFDLEVDELKDIGIEPKGRNSEFCKGEVIVFRADTGADQYRFILNEQSIQNSSSNEFQTSDIESTDSLYVISSKRSCSDTSEVVQVLVIPLPSASFSWERNGRIYTFTPDRTGLSQYQWEFGGGLTSDEERPEVDLTVLGGTSTQVSLTVTNPSRCSNSSAQSVEVPDFANTGAGTLSPKIVVYPNPAKGRIFIDGVQTKVNWRIDGINGQQIIDGQLDPQRDDYLDITILTDGMYLLRIQAEGASQTYRLAVYK